jgi:hypothetical protein
MAGVCPTAPQAAFFESRHFPDAARQALFFLEDLPR